MSFKILKVGTCASVCYVYKSAHSMSFAAYNTDPLLNNIDNIASYKNIFIYERTRIDRLPFRIKNIIAEIIIIVRVLEKNAAPMTNAHHGLYCNTLR